MNKWISVDERLPISGDMVIVYDQQGWMWFAFLNEWDKWEHQAGDEPGIKVTHWTFPPIPPKKKKAKNSQENK